MSVTMATTEFKSLPPRVAFYLLLTTMEHEASLLHMVCVLTVITYFMLLNRANTIQCVFIILVDSF